MYVQQHILASDLQPAKNLKDLFIDNNRNGCTIRSRSSQTFPLRETNEIKLKIMAVTSCTVVAGFQFLEFWRDWAVLHLACSIFWNVWFLMTALGNYSGLPNNKWLLNTKKLNPGTTTLEPKDLGNGSSHRLTRKKTFSQSL